MLSNYLDHAASILMVKDLQQSIHYYHDLLGFSVEFLWEDPPSYAVLKVNEKIQIHLSKLDKALTLPIRPVLYIYSTDVDKLYKSFKEKGIEIHHPIGDRDYQMRDFDVVDPDGHLLTFGQNI